MTPAHPSTFRPPAPRTEIGDPALTRPDWLVGRPRDRRQLWLDRNENTDPHFHRLLDRLLAEVAGRIAAEYPDTTRLYLKVAR